MKLENHQNNKIVFLIFGEHFSGIIAGQALDVAALISDKSRNEVLVIAYISTSKFFHNRYRYKSYYNNCIIIPLIFGSSIKLIYEYLLFVILKITCANKIICRGVRAAYLGSRMKNAYKIISSLVYDARGAHYAESLEYFRYKYKWDNEKLEYEKHLEINAIQNSDLIISVSNKLVNYWKTNYKLILPKIEIIPCTLNNYFKKTLIPEIETKSLRKKVGFKDDQVVLVYAGSVAGWQSFEVLNKFLISILSFRKDVGVLFLSKAEIKNLDCFHLFPDRVKQNWVAIEEVFNYLSVGDYGLLIREDTVTNQVAAPVKFAEYLSAGLDVIISPNVGDYSDLVVEKDLGILVDLSDLEVNKITLKNVLYKKKRGNNKFALDNFTKEKFINNYLNLL